MRRFRRRLARVLPKLLGPLSGAVVFGCGASREPAPAPSSDPATTDGGGGPSSSPSARPRPTSGLLFYASHLHEGEALVLSNPSIVGALYQLYWSEIEPAEGRYEWAALDANIARWAAAGKKVALRIMWSSSGYWPDPAAKTPTPAWVWSAGARFALHAASGTEVPLFWDPIYLRSANAFLDAVARRYADNPDVLFVDVTPGAETNPYRFGTIDDRDPSFRDRFLATAASDGNRYGDALWWTTLQAYLAGVRGRFGALPVLVTLNAAAMPTDRSRMNDVGDRAVEHGLWVGQNGLKGSSYETASSGARWQTWATRSRVFFEMHGATGAEEGSMREVVDACLRVQCSWLNVYATDVVKATPGTPTYDPAWEAALAFGAESLRR